MQQNTPAVEQKASRKISFLIDPNNGCNLNCMHCGLDRPHLVHYSKQQTMSVDDFKRVLQIMEPYVGSIGFGCIREPLVHPSIRQLFQLVDEHESIRDISLATNGVLLDRSMADYILSTNLEWNLNISMESSNPATYERIRRGSTFSLIKDNIAYLVGLREKAGQRIKVNLSSVIFKTNLAEYTQLFDFAESMGIDSIAPMQLEVHDGNRHLALSENEEEMMVEVFENLQHRAENSQLNFTLEGFRQQMDKDPATDRCSTVVMNQTGHIYPPGYRKSIGTVFNPDDLKSIKAFYGLD